MVKSMLFRRVFGAMALSASLFGSAAHASGAPADGELPLSPAARQAIDKEFDPFTPFDKEAASALLSVSGQAPRDSVALEARIYQIAGDRPALVFSRVFDLQNARARTVEEKISVGSPCAGQSAPAPQPQAAESPCEPLFDTAKIGLIAYAPAGEGPLWVTFAAKYSQLESITEYSFGENRVSLPKVSTTGTFASKARVRRDKPEIVALTRELVRRGQPKARLMIAIGAQGSFAGFDPVAEAAIVDRVGLAAVSRP